MEKPKTRYDVIRRIYMILIFAIEIQYCVFFFIFADVRIVGRAFTLIGKLQQLQYTNLLLSNCMQLLSFCLALDVVH